MANDPCVSDQTQIRTLESSLEQILEAVHPVAGIDLVPLKQARGRVLAEALAAPMNLPAFSNAAMDGFALRSADTAHGGAAGLAVIGTSWAGRRYTEPVHAGQCARIFTGAALPPGADSVVMQEEADCRDQRVSVRRRVAPGECVRTEGQELTVGKLALPAGKRLTAADIGLIACLGQPVVTVLRRPRVAFLSTGDELRPLGSRLAPGHIYDSNRYVLDALLGLLAVETLDLGRVPDDRDALKEALSQAARCSDAVISTGGASVGAADYLTRVVGELGRLDLWRVASKPGKPFAFGRIGESYLFGLPGNPVSMMVTFLHLVQPALLKLMGTEPAPPLRVPARCQTRLDKASGRMEFQRGVYCCAPDGTLTVAALPEQGSDRLTSLTRANCFIVLPMDSRGAQAGDTVLIEPFAEHV